MLKQENSYPSKKNNKKPNIYHDLNIIFSKIRENGLFLDSCILSYYLLSHYENMYKTNIRKDRRLNINLDILNKIINISGKVYVTPQILAEVSTEIRNSAGNIRKEEVWDSCKDLMLSILNEHYIEHHHILKNRHLSKFGISDVSIILIKELKNNMKPPVLLTLDGDLKGICYNETFCEIAELKDIEDMINKLPK